MPELYDLTHPIHENIPTWTGECCFKKSVVSDYPNPRVMVYECTAGISTHIDAPCHFIPGGRSVDQISLKELYAPLCILDVRKKIPKDLSISLEDVHEYEKKHGKIPPHSVVCGLTGWSARWQEPEKYRNLNAQGMLSIPGFSKATGPLFLERGIAGLGIDTLSPDGADMTYPLHHLLLGAGKFLLENLTNLERLPPKGAHILIAPLKIEGAAEVPVRAIGIV